MKKAKRYQILVTDFPRHSQFLGKGKMVSYRRACRIVKRLKRSNVDCYKMPIETLV